MTSSKMTSSKMNNQMNFCEYCDNMLYFKIDNDNNAEIKYICNNCNYEISKNLSNNNCIYSINYSQENQEIISDYINKYTHLDPTLPRVNNIDCANKECVTYKNPEEKEVIYIKYNSEELKYFYLCSKCKTCWKNDIGTIKIISY